jgi:hypothetical protein
VEIEIEFFPVTIGEREERSVRFLELSFGVISNRTIKLKILSI